MRWPPAIAVVGAVLALTGCDGDEAAPAPASPEISPGPGAEAPDPRDDLLVASVEELRATLTAAHGHLLAAGDAADLPAAHAAAEAAVHTLTAHPELAGDLDGDGTVRTLEVAPLFPGPTELLAEDTSYDDQLARTLTAARATGATGAAVVDLLRDPVAGDLGSWQRDAGGMLDLVAQAATPAPTPEAEQTIGELPGEATKALAWALLALDARDLAAATDAGERGAAHLELTITALDTLDLP